MNDGVRIATYFMLLQLGLFFTTFMLLYLKSFFVVISVFGQFIILGFQLTVLLNKLYLEDEE